MRNLASAMLLLMLVGCGTRAPKDKPKGPPTRVTNPQTLDGDPKSAPQGEPQNGPQNPKDAPKNEPLPNPQGEPKNEPLPDPQGEPKNEPLPNPKGDGDRSPYPQEEPRDEPPPSEEPGQPAEPRRGALPQDQGQLSPVVGVFGWSGANGIVLEIDPRLMVKIKSGSILVDTTNPPTAVLPEFPNPLRAVSANGRFHTVGQYVDANGCLETVELFVTPDPVNGGVDTTMKFHSTVAVELANGAPWPAPGEWMIPSPEFVAPPCNVSYCYATIATTLRVLLTRVAPPAPAVAR